MNDFWMRIRKFHFHPLTLSFKCVQGHCWESCIKETGNDMKLKTLPLHSHKRRNFALKMLNRYFSLTIVLTKIILSTTVLTSLKLFNPFKMKTYMCGFVKGVNTSNPSGYKKSSKCCFKTVRVQLSNHNLLTTEIFSAAQYEVTVYVIIVGYGYHDDQASRL